MHIECTGFKSKGETEKYYYNLLVSYETRFYFADRVVVKSCYRYESSWTYFRFNATLTNIWCGNQCKKSVDNYRYCGTSVSMFSLK